MAEKKKSRPKKKPRYQRVMEILNQAAGKSKAYYDGYDRPWNLPLSEFLEAEIYGVRMIAPEKELPGGGQVRQAAADSSEESCCHSGAENQAGADHHPGDESHQAGRGEESGLIKGLKAEFPFDGSHFPRIPWGIGAQPVPASDILFIQNWIDDGCPPQDVEKPVPPDKPWQNVCLEDRHLSPKSTNTFKLQSGEIKQRKNAECLSAGYRSSFISSPTAYRNLQSSSAVRHSAFLRCLISPAWSL